MYLPDVPTTKILTIETLTSARDQVRPVMSDGVARTVALYLGGKIDQWFARQDKPGVFILNMSSVEDARLMPDGLPLGLKDMMSFELIPPATICFNGRGKRRNYMDARETNKALALEAFDTLFNKRDYKSAEKFWSPNYIQHSARIGPGRDGLFNLIKEMPETLKYEPGLIVADDNYVVIHGRFSGFGTPHWIAADILRIENGQFIEHWDVLQDEASASQSLSNLPMFGDAFPVY